VPVAIGANTVPLAQPFELRRTSESRDCHAGGGTADVLDPSSSPCLLPKAAQLILPLCASGLTTQAGSLAIWWWPGPGSQSGILFPTCRRSTISDWQFELQVQQLRPGPRG